MANDVENIRIGIGNGLAGINRRQYLRFGKHMPTSEHMLMLMHSLHDIGIIDHAPGLGQPAPRRPRQPSGIDQLNAYRMTIQPLNPMPAADAGMPGSLIEGDHLYDRPIAIDHQMGRCLARRIEKGRRGPVSRQARGIMDDDVARVDLAAMIRVQTQSAY